MTDEMIALRALLEKSSDAGQVRRGSYCRTCFVRIPASIRNVRARSAYCLCPVTRLICPATDAPRSIFMLGGQSFSEYVQALRRQLREPGRSDQLDVLINELANLRLQIRNLTNIVSALAVYQEAAGFLPETIKDGEVRRRLPLSVLIDATHHLPLAEGFHGIEYTDAGVAFRWTGPPKLFRFNVWIDRSSAISLQLNAFHCGHPLNELNTRLYVDGVGMPVRWDSERVAFISGNIQSAHSTQMTTIEFELAASFAAKSDDDNRQLGIPFCSLAIDSKKVELSRPEFEQNPTLS